MLSEDCMGPLSNSLRALTVMWCSRVGDAAMGGLHKGCRCA